MPTTLETSSHFLEFFPGSTACYYTLADKAHPTYYTPRPLTETDCHLTIAPDEKEKHLLDIRLGETDIGQIDSNDDESINALAIFTAQWREALSAIAENNASTANSGSGADISAAANIANNISSFYPISVVTTGITSIPRLFNNNPAANAQGSAYPLSQDSSALSTNTDSTSIRSSRPTSIANTLTNLTIDSTLESPINTVAHTIDQIYAQRDQFLVEKTLRLRLVTWNLHGEPITKAGNLDALLGRPALYDLYVVAIQESDEIGPKNLYANTLTLQNTKDVILSALNTNGSANSEDKDSSVGNGYRAIAHNQLLGMMIVLFAADPIAAELSGVEIATTGTGLFGVWGNKGAASLKITLGADASVGVRGTDLVFLNCHLAAGEGKPGIDRRKWELSEIERKLGVPGLVGTNPKPEIIFEDVITDDYSDDLPSPPEPATIDSRVTISSSNSKNSTGTSHDRIYFLLGDLNYRVGLDPDMVIQFLASKDYETVLSHDTLFQQIRERKVLTGFKEHEINFMPTYKYKVGTDEYDDNKPGNNDKARAPSFTDRIFFRAMTAPDSGAALTIKEYNSLMEYRVSDHKPVYAMFELECRLIDAAKRKTVVDSVLKQSDSIENSSKRTISVTPTELLVDDAIVLRAAEGAVVIEQTTAAAVIPNGEDDALEWDLDLDSDIITATPTHGVLPRGAKQYIHFRTILPVQKHTTQSMAAAVAILRLGNGQDIFVPVEFRAQPTCLGASLDLLSRMSGGARNTSALMDASSTNMPREIWNCVDYLWTHTVSDMFESLGAEIDSAVMENPDWKGEQSICEQVQDWLDLGQDFDREVLDSANTIRANSGVYSVAHQFLLLLWHLDGGVIPVEYYSIVLHGREGSMMILERIPRVNVNVLLYIMSFLGHLVSEGLDRDYLRKCFYIHLFG
jgi:phosphatidylinositol-bisphosphatase